MSPQNIYDDAYFFERYQALRGSPDNANDLVERPALFSLAPPLKGRAVLDLGCGCGENCAAFAALGARRVVGLDLSRNMLEAARREHPLPGVTFLELPMEELDRLEGPFDVVFSSLAVHYVEDFGALARNVFRLLSPGGTFLFSQENPINTCFTTGKRWTCDEEGRVLHANLSHYSLDGERRSRWFVDGVVKYHRTFSSLVNSLVDAGFRIDKLLEPVPSAEVMERFPEFQKGLHRPDFLLVRVQKPE